MSQTIAASSELLTKPEADDYRSTSRAAVIALVLAILGLSAFTAPWLVILPLLGVFAGIIGLNAIKKFPDELLGKPLAIAGLAISGLTLVIAPAYHGYIYATEVPEGYTRVSFFTLMADKGQPDVPTNDALQWNGQQIFIKGYVHPSSMSSYEAKKFVIVPDLGDRKSVV